MLTRRYVAAAEAAIIATYRTTALRGLLRIRCNWNNSGVINDVAVLKRNDLSVNETLRNDEFW